jgi:2-succinyl-5-enolpyruvyl-6-hydroxy-3-cyclohexene-1-carboxylate synthase
MNNIDLAVNVLRACAAAGCRELVLCAGARNAPLVAAVAKASGVRTHSFFEERGAAFFALGRMQAEGRPVAVITTSGTAAAELLPAVIEADYQSLPLIALTADRPRRYRGSGAPQAIVQPGLYSHYVEKSWDIETERSGRLEWNGTLEWSGRRPVHVNVCFDEPLLESTVASWAWPPEAEPAPKPARAESGVSDVSFGSRNPLIVVGGLAAADRAMVLEWLRAWRRPLYLEGPSGLRGHPALQAWEIRAGERALRRLDIDGVIRVGGVPTSRFWRDLESSALPVLSFSRRPFSGLARASGVFPLEGGAAVGELQPWSETDPALLDEAPLAELCERFPLSEPAWVNWLSRRLPEEARLFLGNSLPIREWDLAAARPARPVEIFANRGVNGIDGLLSTFAGVCRPDLSNWCLLGDLSTLYDLSGPWAWRAHPCADVNIVILNNGGGRIFRRMFHDPLFENDHGLGFADWARFWDLEYICLEDERPASLPPARAGRPRVIEIRPSAAETDVFWRALEAAT